MSTLAFAHARQHQYRYKVRATRAPGMQLTERDIAILKAIHRYRVLHRGQISEMFWQTATDEGGSARRRLGLLYQHGYLERIPRYINPPMNNPGPAYRLAARGAAVLAEQAGEQGSSLHYWGKADDETSHVTTLGHSYLEHALLLADIRKEFERKVNDAGCTIETWLDDLDLRKLWKTERVWIQLTPNAPRENLAIAPDGYFVLSTPRGRGHFFLEADRGTETINKQWKRKMLSYAQYLVSGKFHQRYHAAKSVGFRVLAVIPTEARAKNLHQAAESYVQPRTVSIFLFTTNDLFRRSSLFSPIWWRGGVETPQALL